MLPNVFPFEQYADGLCLGDRVVASACQANCDLDPPWRVFTRTEADSIRYMEAWTTKWESRRRLRQDFERSQA